MNCTADRPAPFRCPTRAEVIAAVLALLPTGRAWQSNEGGPLPYHDAAFDPAVFDAETRPGTILYRYWAAFGDVLKFVNDRLCALRLEFFCATQSETRDLWMQEYDLPDACDPFPDLCEKVAAQGGARCEYFNQRIARMGWRAECFDRSAHCGARFGATKFGARHATFGNANVLALVVRVHTGDPSDLSSIAARNRKPLFGQYRFGQRPSCDTVAAPSISKVRCLMERIVPAHVEIQYTF